MFSASESEVLERKESWTDKAKETICAFANDLADSGKPGVLFIGQKDDRTCAGLDDSKIRKLLENIPDVRNYILPSPVISVEKRTINGCMIVAVIIQQAHLPPVRFNGRCHVRVGSTTRTASAEEERILTGKKNRNLVDALYFEQQKTDLPSRLEDLDWLFIEREYLPHAISREVLDENNRPPEMQLSSLRFLTADGVPNNAAVLCFHYTPKAYLPGAYIQFVRFSGDSMDSSVLDQKEMHGPVFQQIRLAEEKFGAHLSVSGQIGGGAESPDYPMEAIKQTVRNAVMHRSYEPDFTAPIRCLWFLDRIEVHSSGGLFGNVNRDIFGEEGAGTAYRNPLLAEALKVEKFVERFGAGIGTIKETMRKNGNPPPVFEAKENHVLVVLPGKII